MKWKPIETAPWYKQAVRTCPKCKAEVPSADPTRGEGVLCLSCGWCSDDIERK